MSKEITIVTCPSGDWEALYLEGVKVLEGHTLQLDRVLDMIGVKAEFSEVIEDENGDAEFPDDLDECNFGVTS